MPMKEILHRLQPVQLYIVLALSVVYFLFQLFLSHITHSLTLLVDSYHMLCNIIALTGCILTIKHGDCKTSTSSSSTSLSISKDDSLSTSQQSSDKESKSSTEIVVKVELGEDIKKKIVQKSRQQHEKSLKNTFGWARIDILTMLIVCTFMASLCFSSLVEAIQTLCHIHHQDAMHNPVWVLMLGVLGVVINGFCYLMIGGYTYHQGSFLHITSSGAVILDHVATGEAVRQGERRLSRTRKAAKPQIDEKITKRENVKEMLRDICSTLIVIICAIIVFMIGEEPASLDDLYEHNHTEEALFSTIEPSSESLTNDLVQHGYSRFVDPVSAIISCILLLYLSYPYMKESGLILLQTIPATIDIEEFKKNLLGTFAEIINVHDLHIWQLNAHKYVSTAHLIFHDQKVYIAINDAIVSYFHAQGIDKVTIQPEFQSIQPTSPLLINKRESGGSIECLMQCQEDGCFERHCCKNDEAFKKIAEAKTKSAIKTTNSDAEEKTSTEIELHIPNIPKTTIIQTNEIKTSDLKTDS